MSLFGIMKFWCLICLLLIIDELNGFVPNDILKKFEYKLSFKGPHLVFKDGTIPFWDFAGSRTYYAVKKFFTTL